MDGDCKEAGGGREGEEKGWSGEGNVMGSWREETLEREWGVGGM